MSAPSVAHEEARLVPLQDVVVEELGGDSIDYLHFVGDFSAVSVGSPADNTG